VKGSGSRRPGSSKGVPSASSPRSGHRVPALGQRRPAPLASRRWPAPLPCLSPTACAGPARTGAFPDGLLTPPLVRRRGRGRDGLRAPPGPRHGRRDVLPRLHVLLVPRGRRRAGPRAGLRPACLGHRGLRMPGPSWYVRASLARSAGLRTVVFLPCKGGVLELGSVAAIREDPEVLRAVHSAFRIEATRREACLHPPPGGRPPGALARSHEELSDGLDSRCLFSSSFLTIFLSIFLCCVRIPRAHS
jgi:hypothetical protein